MLNEASRISVAKGAAKISHGSIIGVHPRGCYIICLMRRELNVAWGMVCLRYVGYLVQNLAKGAATGPVIQWRVWFWGCITHTP